MVDTWNSGWCVVVSGSLHRTEAGAKTGPLGPNLVDTAEIRVTFNPLVRWVWLGGALMAIGGLVVMWPAADKQRAQSGYAAVLKPRHVRVPELIEA